MDFLCRTHVIVLKKLFFGNSNNIYSRTTAIRKTTCENFYKVVGYSRFIILLSIDYVVTVSFSQSLYLIRKNAPTKMIAMETHWDWEKPCQ